MSEAGDDKVARLAERIAAGDAAALARAITAVETGRPAAAKLLARMSPAMGRAITVGFTGPPGVGKSTLISAFIAEMRRRGRRVAVLAVDPSSPISGGAILGDRVRMAEHTDDEGVFIRSIASRGHLGGLSRTTARVSDLVDAAGYEVVVIETVGAGQSEVEVANVAATTVVVGAPGAGDDVQAIKAGILEVADILVVNKADREGAAETRRALKAMLRLRGRGRTDVPVLETVAIRGEGIAALADAVERHHAGLDPAGRSARLRERFVELLSEGVARRVATRLHALDAAALDALCDPYESGERDIDELAADIVEHGFDAVGARTA